MHWTGRATLDEWDKIYDIIFNELTDHGFEHSEIISFLVALDEIFINISNYAYAPDIGNVKIEMNVEDNMVTVGFTDKGKKFNPLEIDPPDIRAPRSKRKPGGLGIFISRSKTDEMLYEYKNNSNKLKLIKNFSDTKRKGLEIYD